MNLLTSFTEEIKNPTSTTLKPMDGIETLEEDEHGSDWLGEYQRGCDWEIYTTELSSTFEGTTFCALADMLYHKLGIVLFGLEIEDLRKDKPTKKIYLNPADFIIPSHEEYKVLAFVIAKNKAQSDLTFSKVSDHDSIFNSGMTFSHLSMLSSALSNNNRYSMLGQPEEGGGDAFEMKLKNKMDRHFFPADGTGDDPANTDVEANSPTEKERKRISFRNKLEWQLLLRKYEQEKTTESIQEELQKQEDKYLQENYFVRSQNHLLELSEAYVHTSVSEELPFMENHIIIIGKSLSNLYDLIRPLRAKSLGILKHIIILYPTDFPIRVWQRISIFESVWIVRGSPLEENDLRRCGIFKAKQIVLLASAAGGGIGFGSAGSEEGQPKKSSSGSSSSSAIPGLNALDDVDAIFCYQAIKRMNESAHIVVEIVRHTNVGYLDPESGLNSSDVDYKFTPQFSSGTLFATSMLDTLVCQSFYNTKIIDILNKFVGGQFSVNPTDRTREQYYDHHGHLHMPQQGNMCYPSSSPGPRNNNNNKSGATKGLMNSSLYQIALPEKLESRTYGALFSLLTKRKQIPIGLLRGVFANTKSGPKNNTTPYVYTNPPKDTELFSCDKIFVLSQKPIKITRVSKDETKETHFYSHLRTKRKTAEDVLNVVSLMKEDLYLQQKKNKELENKLATLYEEFQENMKKVNVNLESIYSDYLIQNDQMSKASAPPSRRSTGYSNPNTMTNNQSSFDEMDNNNTNNNAHGSSSPPPGLKKHSLRRARTSSSETISGGGAGTSGFRSPPPPTSGRKSPGSNSRSRPASAASSANRSVSPQRTARKQFNSNSSV
jgi:hypothetical protein